MGDLQIVIAALFVSAAGLNALANWLDVPYPIPLVLGGLVLGLVPGIPDIQLNPDLVLLVFLTQPCPARRARSDRPGRHRGGSHAAAPPALHRALPDRRQDRVAIHLHAARLAHVHGLDPARDGIRVFAHVRGGGLSTGERRQRLPHLDDVGGEHLAVSGPTSSAL